MEFGHSVREKKKPSFRPAQPRRIQTRSDITGPIEQDRIAKASTQFRGILRKRNSKGY
jgi:hypothetical protein